MGSAASSNKQAGQEAIAEASKNLSSGSGNATADEKRQQSTLSNPADDQSASLGFKTPPRANTSSFEKLQLREDDSGSRGGDSQDGQSELGLPYDSSQARPITPQGLQTLHMRINSVATKERQASRESVRVPQRPKTPEETVSDVVQWNATVDSESSQAIFVRAAVIGNSEADINIQTLTTRDVLEDSGFYLKGYKIRKLSPSRRKLDVEGNQDVVPLAERQILELTVIPISDDVKAMTPEQRDEVLRKAMVRSNASAASMLKRSSDPEFQRKLDQASGYQQFYRDVLAEEDREQYLQTVAGAVTKVIRYWKRIKAARHARAACTLQAVSRMKPKRTHYYLYMSARVVQSGIRCHISRKKYKYGNKLLVTARGEGAQGFTDRNTVGMFAVTQEFQSSLHRQPDHSLYWKLLSRLGASPDRLDCMENLVRTVDMLHALNSDIAPVSAVFGKGMRDMALGHAADILKEGFKSDVLSGSTDHPEHAWLQLDFGTECRAGISSLSFERGTAEKRHVPISWRLLGTNDCESAQRDSHSEDDWQTIFNVAEDRCLITHGQGCWINADFELPSSAVQALRLPSFRFVRILLQGLNSSKARRFAIKNVKLAGFVAFRLPAPWIKFASDAVIQHWREYMRNRLQKIEEQKQFEATVPEEENPQELDCDSEPTVEDSNLHAKPEESPVDCNQNSNLDSIQVGQDEESSKSVTSDKTPPLAEGESESTAAEEPEDDITDNKSSNADNTDPSEEKPSEISLPDLPSEFSSSFRHSSRATPREFVMSEAEASEELLQARKQLESLRSRLAQYEGDEGAIELEVSLRAEIAKWKNEAESARRSLAQVQTEMQQALENQSLGSPIKETTVSILTEDAAMIAEKRVWKSHSPRVYLAFNQDCQDEKDEIAKLWPQLEKVMKNHQIFPCLVDLRQGYTPGQAISAQSIRQLLKWEISQCRYFCCFLGNSYGRVLKGSRFSMLEEELACVMPMSDEWAKRAWVYSRHQVEEIQNGSLPAPAANDGGGQLLRNLVNSVLDARLALREGYVKPAYGAETAINDLTLQMKQDFPVPDTGKDNDNVELGDASEQYSAVSRSTMQSFQEFEHGISSSVLQALHHYAENPTTAPALLLAPPGYGKSSILRQWMKEWKSRLGGGGSVSSISSRGLESLCDPSELLLTMADCMLRAAEVPLRAIHALQNQHQQSTQGYGGKFAMEWPKRWFDIAMTASSAHKAGLIIQCVDTSLMEEAASHKMVPGRNWTTAWPTTEEVLKHSCPDQLLPRAANPLPIVEFLSMLPSKLVTDTCVVIACGTVEAAHTAYSRGWKIISLPRPDSQLITEQAVKKISLKGFDTSTLDLSSWLRQEVPAVNMTLHMDVALQEVYRKWSPGTNPLNKLPLGRSTSLLWEECLTRWCEMEEVGRSGHSGMILALLAVSKAGLTEGELRKISHADRFEISGILRCIAPFCSLEQSNGIVSILQSSLRTAIWRRTLSNKRLENDARSRIAEYFDTSDPITPRGILEVPGQYIDMNRTEDVLRVVSRLSYFLAACAAGRHSHISKIWAVLKFSPKAIIERYKTAIEMLKKKDGEWKNAVTIPSVQSAQKQYCTFVDSLDMRPQSLSAWQDLLKIQRDNKEGGTSLALTLQRVAVLAWRGGIHDLSLSCAQEAVNVIKESTATANMALADAHHTLGLCADGAGSKELSQESLHQALKIREEILGAEHPSVADSWKALAQILRKHGLTHQAAEAQDRANMCMIRSQRKFTAQRA